MEPTNFWGLAIQARGGALSFLPNAPNALNWMGDWCGPSYMAANPCNEATGANKRDDVRSQQERKSSEKKIIFFVERCFFA